MAKCGEILANSVEKLYQKHFQSDSWNHASADLDFLRNSSKDEIISWFSTMSFDYVDLVHSLGKIKEFIEFCRENEK